MIRYAKTCLPGKGDVLDYLYKTTPNPERASLIVYQLSTMPSTVRYPNANGKSQPDLANAQLQANAQS